MGGTPASYLTCRAVLKRMVRKDLVIPAKRFEKRSGPSLYVHPRAKSDIGRDPMR
jgi:hypothetical protein